MVELQRELLADAGVLLAERRVLWAVYRDTSPCLMQALKRLADRWQRGSVSLVVELVGALVKRIWPPCNARPYSP